MVEPFSVDLNEFRGQYWPRDPIYYLGRDPRVDLGYSHQIIPIAGNPKFSVLTRAPVVGILIGHPPLSESDDGKNRYLWVIDDRGIPYIFEEPIKALKSNCPKHSNLTGGGQAYVGGEMWFLSREEIYVSGGSGRYPPKNSRQLEDAVEVFISLKYIVKSLGWNLETDKAKRHL